MKPSNSALLIIDVQNDFCEGGALAVPDASQIVPLINAHQNEFSEIIATKDWHPLHHKSFATEHPGRQVGGRIILAGLQQTLWPVHCVEGSLGAAFHPGLNWHKFTKIIYKGQQEEVDSYSAFFDNAKRYQTDLHHYLQAKHISTLYIAGLATDYCVLFTCLDACELGYDVNVIVPACRAVNLHPQDAMRALKKCTKQVQLC